MWQEGEKEGEETDPARQPTVRGQPWGTAGDSPALQNWLGQGWAEQHIGFKDCQVSCDPASIYTRRSDLRAESFTGVEALGMFGTLVK